MDLGEMGWNWLIGATVDIFPRIQSIWPGAYDSVVTLFTRGKWTGWKPYFANMCQDNGKFVRSLVWQPLDVNTALADYHW
jgi:hypothetical protein